VCRLTLVAPLSKRVEPRLAATLASNFVAFNSSETNQDDGSGICLVNEITTAYHKSEKAGFDFIYSDEWTDSLKQYEDDEEITPSTAWMTHVRAATFGIKVNVENSHPFMFDHITGMHNGVIRNKADFTKDMESDSAAFFSYLSRTVNGTALTYEVLKEALEKIRGAFCMLINDRMNPDPSSVWIVVGKERELWAMKNEHFLLINTTKAGFIAVENLRQVLKSLGDPRHELFNFETAPVKLPAETIFFYSSGKMREMGKVKESDFTYTNPNTNTSSSYRGTSHFSNTSGSKTREAARMWADFLAMIDLGIYDGPMVMDALFNTENIKRVWTGLDKETLEKLEKFADYLDESGFLKETEEQSKLWYDICSAARKNCGLDYIENPYEFLSKFEPSVQFPYWLNSIDQLESLKEFVLNYEGQKG
jgi:predicted glutamine amidotransferase